MKLDNLIKEELAILNEVQLNADRLGAALADVESSGGDYKATNPKSSAAGKYQFLWNTWGKEIERVTGVSTKQDFLDSPQAQEKFFKYYVNNELKPQVARLKSDSTKSDVALAALVHFQGPTGAKRYLETGIETSPKINMPVEDYLDRVEQSYYGRSVSSKSKNIGPDFTDQEKQVLGSVPEAKSGISDRAWSDGQRQHYYRFGTDFETNLSLVYPNHKGHVVVLEKGKYQKPTPATWKIQGNNVIVTTDNGIISLTYNATQSKPDVKIEKDAETTFDDIQDWVSYSALALSFILPGWSDIIDIVNGAVWALRGKYLDASLSMIAAIPIVGSVAARSIKVGLKRLQQVKGGEAALRAFTRAFKMKDAAGMAKFLDKLNATGSIPAGLYDDVAKGLEKAHSQVDKLRNLDQVKDWKKLQTSIDEIYENIGVMYKATTIASKAGKTAVIFSKIRKLISPKVGKQINERLLKKGADIYIDQLKKNPKEFAKLYTIIQKSQGRNLRLGLSANDMVGYWTKMYKKSPTEYVKQMDEFMKNNPIWNSKLFSDKLVKLALKPDYFREFLQKAKVGEYLLRTNPLSKWAWSLYTKLPANIARFIDNNYDLDDATKEKLKNPVGVAFDPTMIAAIYSAFFATVFGYNMPSKSAGNEEAE